MPQEYIDFAMGLAKEMYELDCKDDIVTRLISVVTRIVLVVGCTLPFVFAILADEETRKNVSSHIKKMFHKGTGR